MIISQKYHLVSADAGQTIVAPLVDGQNHVVTEWLRPSALPVEQSVASSTADDVELGSVSKSVSVQAPSDSSDMQI